MFIHFNSQNHDPMRETSNILSQQRRSSRILGELRSTRNQEEKSVRLFRGMPKKQKLSRRRYNNAVFGNNTSKMADLANQLTSKKKKVRATNLNQIYQSLCDYKSKMFCSNFKIALIFLLKVRFCYYMRHFGSPLFQ